MKLVTLQARPGQTRAGVILEEHVIALKYPTVLELLRDQEALATLRSALIEHTSNEYILVPDMVHQHEDDFAIPTALVPLWDQAIKISALADASLLTPVPEPPTARDFYAFEQHVKAARANRGLGMTSEWYEIPTFYFTNTSELYGQGADVPYPKGSQALDFELEIACVIGREGKDIPVEQAADYIAGYTIMNDWSARDFQALDMKLNLGPGKGKDFATSLGPWLVTPDELAHYRSGSGASERYDMPMLARINGKEISRGNFKDIFYSFPQMIAWASRNVRLRTGDVLGSGTVGTGCILELTTAVHRWLQPGDVVEMEIAGLGVLRNTVV